MITTLIYISNFYYLLAYAPLILYNKWNIYNKYRKIKHLRTIKISISIFSNFQIYVYYDKIKIVANCWEGCLSMYSERKKPTAIDLFCGVGGITQALKDAGFRVLCGIEYDEHIAESYRKNHDNELIVNDIRKVSVEEVLSKTGIVPGKLDLLAGCPPCQTFSKHSKGKKSKDLRNYLVFQYYRMIRSLRPKYIFMENVPGFRNNSKIFNEIVNVLDNGKNREGRPQYYLHFEKVNAADYGVPQHRERFVLVGVRKDLVDNKDEIKSIYAKPTHINPDLWTAQSKLEKWIPLKEVIYGLEKIEAGKSSNTDSLHKAAALSDLNLLRLKNTPLNGGSRTNWPQKAINSKGEEVELWLECHKKKNVGYKDVYGRMNYNKVAPTLTGGCCAISKGRFGHPEQHRAISLREAALIQTFPPDYEFTGQFMNIALQIGNAVPVRLGTCFFNSIIVHMKVKQIQKLMIILSKYKFRIEKTDLFLNEVAIESTLES